MMAHINTNRRLAQCGFTLIEVMIALALGLMILAGLFMLFSSQSTIYKTQSSRVIAGQDTEFISGFIAADLRSAIVSAVGSADPLATQVTITDAGMGGVNNDTNTQVLTFDAWVEGAGAAGTYAGIDADFARAQRTYRLFLSDGGVNCQESDVQYRGIDMCLRYDRASAGAGNDSTLINTNSEIAQAVTMFRVFVDDATTPAAVAARLPYVGIPPMLPQLNTGGLGTTARVITQFRNAGVTAQVNDSPLGGGGAADVFGYTILLETAVATATQDTTIYDALGRDVSTFENPPRKRIIRYIQVYPRSMVP